MSSAVRAIGPATTRSALRGERRSRGGGTMPQVEIRFHVVLRPNTPVAAAGQRIELPRSEPSSKALMPVATATHAPPEEPPGLSAMSHGLLVVP